jgi:hypothetical protein
VDWVGLVTKVGERDWKELARSDLERGHTEAAMSEFYVAMRELQDRFILMGKGRRESEPSG